MHWLLSRATYNLSDARFQSEHHEWQLLSWELRKAGSFVVLLLLPKQREQVTN